MPFESFEKLSGTAIRHANDCSPKLRFAIDSHLRGNDGSEDTGMTVGFAKASFGLKYLMMKRALSKIH